MPDSDDLTFGDVEGLDVRGEQTPSEGESFTVRCDPADVNAIAAQVRARYMQEWTAPKGESEHAGAEEGAQEERERRYDEAFADSVDLAGTLGKIIEVRHPPRGRGKLTSTTTGSVRRYREPRARACGRRTRVQRRARAPGRAGRSTSDDEPEPDLSGTPRSALAEPEAVLGDGRR